MILITDQHIGIKTEMYTDATMREVTVFAQFFRFYNDIYNQDAQLFYCDKNGQWHELNNTTWQWQMRCAGYVQDCQEGLPEARVHEITENNDVRVVNI